MKEGGTSGTEVGGEDGSLAEKANAFRAVPVNTEEDTEVELHQRLARRVVVATSANEGAAVGRRGGGIAGRVLGGGEVLERLAE